MDLKERIEQALGVAVSRAAGGAAPPRLGEAIRHAVFPGGARIRPRLCLSVAIACGESDPALADSAASALELLHCASLAHDDLPSFDGADTRRGRPSVWRAHGEPLALLAGDALIVLAFQTIAAGAARAPERAGALALVVAEAAGMPHGIVAGQGWENEAEPCLESYHRAKTGALFVGAVRAGAIAAGRDPADWVGVGAKLGEAYQVADDLRDALVGAETLGKPAGQDARHDRPSAVGSLGIRGAAERLERLLGQAIAAIPPVPGSDMVETFVRREAGRLAPVPATLHAA